MFGKIYLDFPNNINVAKRKCKCRYCKGIIIKGEKRVSEGFRNRFGWNTHHYHIYCTARMYIELHNEIENDIKKMLKISGFAEDETAPCGRSLQDLLNLSRLTATAC